jgi:hypothetical protein
MLDTIEDFEFSNVASQLAIQVLDSLKVTFDENDLELLKTFVRKQLASDRAYLKFEGKGSSKHTTRGHLAAVIKMALVLKKLTLEGGLLAMKKVTDDIEAEAIEEKELVERSLR